MVTVTGALRSYSSLTRTFDAHSHRLHLFVNSSIVSHEGQRNFAISSITLIQYGRRLLFWLRIVIPMTPSRRTNLVSETFQPLHSTTSTNNLSHHLKHEDSDVRYLSFDDPRQWPGRTNDVNYIRLFHCFWRYFCYASLMTKILNERRWTFRVSEINKETCYHPYF